MSAREKWDDPEIENRGRAQYARLKAELWEKYEGQYAVINVDSGEYVVGPSTRQAVNEYDEKYPGTDAIIVGLNPCDDRPI